MWKAQCGTLNLCGHSGQIWFSLKSDLTEWPHYYLQVIRSDLCVHTPPTYLHRLPGNNIGIENYIMTWLCNAEAWNEGGWCTFSFSVLQSQQALVCIEDIVPFVQHWPVGTFDVNPDSLSILECAEKCLKLCVTGFNHVLSVKSPT